jgi:hypothetical protein
MNRPAPGKKKEAVRYERTEFWRAWDNLGTPLEKLGTFQAILEQEPRLPSTYADFTLEQTHSAEIETTSGQK